jgi:predicted HAD superfamily Cof-like phosphohydrolase
MNENLLKVYIWHKTFCDNSTHQAAESPVMIDRELAATKVEFIIEELVEYMEKGIQSNNLPEVLDALCDLQYFLNGMIVVHGLQNKFDDAFDIVHNSNMSKLGADGKPIYRADGKVLKGPNYWNPKDKLEKLLNGNNE